MASYQEVKLRLLSRHEEQDLSFFADLFATDPDLPFIWPFLNLEQEFLSYWFVISVSCKIESLGPKPSNALIYGTVRTSIWKKADKYINNKIRWSQHKHERKYSILNHQRSVWQTMQSHECWILFGCLEVSNKGDASRLWDAWRRFLSFFLSAKAVRQLPPQVVAHNKQQREKL